MTVEHVQTLTGQVVATVQIDFPQLVFEDVGQSQVCNGRASEGDVSQSGGLCVAEDGRHFVSDVQTFVLQHVEQLLADFGWQTKVGN